MGCNCMVVLLVCVVSLFVALRQSQRASIIPALVARLVANGGLCQLNWLASSNSLELSLSSHGHTFFLGLPDPSFLTGPKDPKGMNLISAW